MVSILPPKRNIFNAIADSMQQFGQHAPQLLEERYQTQRGLSAIDQLQKDLAASGGDMSKVLPAVAKAVSLNPNLQKSGYVEHALQMAKNLNAQNIPRPGEQQEEPFQPQERQPLPGFMQQPGQEPSQNKFFPSNQPGGESPGNIPQEATTGEIQHLLTPPQKIPVIKKLMKDSADQGVPMSFEQARNEVNSVEEDKKLHNRQVEEERKQRVGAQREYGEKAVTQLDKVFPGATPEMQAIFKKKGEQAAKEGKSEADIDRHLAVEAKNFRNMYSNIQKDLEAPRLQNQIERAFNGSEKDFEQAAGDLRVKLKPLLDLGLYDSSRKLLTDLGYYPEEREQIINPMSEREKTLLNKIPTTKKTVTEKPIVLANIPQTQKISQYTPQDIQNIKDGLLDLKQADPNFSLVLARKAFEDKGYDWRVFKDALNSLQTDDGFELENDQQIQQSILDTPPLNTLQKLLQGLNIIGR
jgi:hypothetical protein